MFTKYRKKRIVRVGVHHYGSLPVNTTNLPIQLLPNSLLRCYDAAVLLCLFGIHSLENIAILFYDFEKQQTALELTDAILDTELSVGDDDVISRKPNTLLSLASPRPSFQDNTIH